MFTFALAGLLAFSPTTTPPDDSTPVPAEETALAEAAFLDQVTRVAGEAPEFVVCESHRSMSEPDSPFGEQPTVVTTCFGTVPAKVYWGEIVHVAEQLNLILTSYTVDGLPQFVDPIPAPPLAVGPATATSTTVAAAVTTVAATTTTTASGPATTLGDGIWIVGTDIAPGTYRAVGGGVLCYWERLSGLSGETDDVIASGFLSDQDQPVVEIAPTDVAFGSSRCGTWTRVEQ